MDSDLYSDVYKNIDVYLRICYVFVNTEFV